MQQQQEITINQEVEQVCNLPRRNAKYFTIDSDDDSMDADPADPPTTFIIQPDLIKEEPCQPEEEVRSTLDQPASFGDTATLHQSEIPTR
jgi:hypothetical protein